MPLPGSLCEFAGVWSTVFGGSPAYPGQTLNDREGEPRHVPSFTAAVSGFVARYHAGFLQISP